MSQRQAAYLSFVFSTSAAGIAVRGQDGSEDYVSVPMRGCVDWHGGWAHEPKFLAEMATENLRELQARGWRFDQPGYLSQAWRQHDMVVTGADDRPLIPALGWRCNLAVAETERLNAIPSFAAAVGRVEERFVAPKLLWAIKADPTLRDRIGRVMFSGDWFAGMLCGEWTLSASDGLSNGLLNQATKHLAVAELEGAGMNPAWFPRVIPGDAVVGAVRESDDPAWRELTQALSDWRVVAFLGDNQATAAGCGAYRHDEIVISLGNSATVNRICRPGVALKGRAVRFDYWTDRLLLLMSDGAAWYEGFLGVEWAKKHDELNAVGLQADFEQVVRVPPPDSVVETATQLDQLRRPERVASIQFSVAFEALLNARTMLQEVRNAEEPIATFVLTGGLIRCPLMRFTLRVGLQLLAPQSAVLVNDRQGELSYKTDALGAVFNAMLAERGDSNLRAIVEGPCPRRTCDDPPPEIAAGLRSLISRHLVEPIQKPESD